MTLEFTVGISTAGKHESVTVAAETVTALLDDQARSVAAAG